MSLRDDQDPLIPVFETADPALVPLAASALDQAGIDYGYRPAEGQFPVVFGHPPAFVDADGSVEIVVREADAARARDLLADLASADVAPPLAAPPVQATGPAATGGPTPIVLIDAATQQEVGRITEAQRQFLVDQLEEESDVDHDYYFDAPTIDLLASAGGDAALLAVLRHALGSREGIELRWTRA